MPSFSKKSLANLEEAHQDLQTLFHAVVARKDCKVIEGSRGKEEQNWAFATKKSKTPWPKSNHNVDGEKRTTSWAVDVLPYPFEGWDDYADFEALSKIVFEEAARLKAEGKMKYEVRWGGDWDRDGDWHDEKFLDMPHYELVNVAYGE